jgi:hypothetical protein
MHVLVHTAADAAERGTWITKDGLLGPVPKHPTILSTASSETFLRGISALMIRPDVA